MKMRQKRMQRTQSKERKFDAASQRNGIRGLGQTGGYYLDIGQIQNQFDDC